MPVLTDASAPKLEPCWYCGTLTAWLTRIVVNRSGGRVRVHPAACVACLINAEALAVFPLEACPAELLERAERNDPHVVEFLAGDDDTTHEA